MLDRRCNKPTNMIINIKPTDIESESKFLSGWKLPEHDFIWALGPINIIHIPVGPTSEYRGKNLYFAIKLDVPITASNPAGSRLTVSLGGIVLFDKTIKGRDRLVFHAPASTTSPRLDILHITNHNLASIDGMALGFRLYEIEIEEIPILQEGDIVTFGLGSRYNAILGSGWKDPEEGFCWSSGIRSRLTLCFEPEACCQDERGGVRVAEILMTVSFHDRHNPEFPYWHVLDFLSNELLLHRQIHPGIRGLVPINAYVPLGSNATGELEVIDYCASSPAYLGNDPNDNNVLGFQLISLELKRIHTLPVTDMPAVAELLEPGSPLMRRTQEEVK